MACGGLAVSMLHRGWGLVWCKEWDSRTVPVEPLPISLIMSSSGRSYILLLSLMFWAWGSCAERRGDPAQYQGPTPTPIPTPTCTSCLPELANRSSSSLLCLLRPSDCSLSQGLQGPSRPQASGLSVPAGYVNFVPEWHTGSVCTVQ